MSERERTPLVRTEPEPRAADPSGMDGAAAWTVVAALTVILTVASGARFLFGVVLKPVSDQYGWDRAALSGAVLVGMIVLSIFQPLVGLIIDRVGPKAVIIVGCTILGLSLIPLASAHSLWQIYFFWGVLSSVGLAAASPVNATAFVGRWFQRRRAAALSIATSGSAFGQLLIVPVASWILTRTDWQTTYRLLAITLLVVMVPLGLVVLRNGPGERATRPARPEHGVDLRTALATPAFWLLAFGFVTCGWTMAFPNTHFMAYADDMGMTVLHAANVISVTAVVSILGSLALGIVADRHRRTSVLALVYALRGVAFLLLAVLPVGNLIYAYAIVLGISWTATTPLTAAIAADRYGPRHLGVIFGAMFTFMNLGFGVAAWVDGMLYELSGTYAPSLAINVAFGAAAAVAVLLVERRPAAAFEPVAAGAAAD
ncbi:MAG: MFS transporter [Thermomicrobiales bacterium]|nr:MFS transporter [Thermomicrobiales bacterium]